MNDSDASDGEETAQVHHLKKRARKDKSLVVVFDPEARKEYVTGFQKRKNQRRKIAEAEKQVKERHKRLLERKERRIRLVEARGGEAENGEATQLAENEAAESEVEQLSPPLGGTVVYEDGDTLTTVTTCSISQEEEDVPEVSGSHEEHAPIPKTTPQQPKKKKTKASSKKNFQRKMPLKSSKRKKNSKSSGSKSHRKK